MTRQKVLTRRTGTHILFYIILVALAIFYLLPIYLMILTGVKPFNEVDLKTMWSLPTQWSPHRKFHRRL